MQKVERGRNNNNLKTDKKVNNKETPGNDEVILSDGQVFYPCRLCNSLFHIKKLRTLHVCTDKNYIISLNDEPNHNSQKIDIQQHIILSKDDNLAANAGHEAELPTNNNDHSAILKEKDDSDADSTQLFKTESFSCKKCNEEFDSSIELLRHSRTDHSYPKIVMALSEIQKYYAMTDRKKCPICNKPLLNTFKSAFVKHLHTHTNEMNYSCAICKKKFRRLDHMKAHEKRHIVTKE